MKTKSLAVACVFSVIGTLMTPILRATLSHTPPPWDQTSPEPSPTPTPGTANPPPPAATPSGSDEDDAESNDDQDADDSADDGG